MNTGVFVYSLILMSLQLRICLGHVVNDTWEYEDEEKLEDWTSLRDDVYNDLPEEYLHTFGNNAIDIGSQNGNEDISAKLRFYYNSIENYTELSISEAHNIFSQPWYDPNKITIVFCHGFTGHPNGPAVTSVIDFLLKQAKSNVILLNWQRLAAMVYPNFVNSYLNWAAPNAIKLGADFAETLLKLSTAGMDLNNTHLVGHSLGAHVFGIAGNKLQENGIQLPWITGLDPAGSGFDLKPTNQRLHPGSARFVAVIHTDPSKYGSRREMGFVDFWPNFKNRGPVLQAGCTNGRHPRFSAEDLCNHNKCWQFFIDSLKYPETILGSHAKNFRIWKNNPNNVIRANVLELGIFKPDAVPGNYYFTTAADSPYGLGEDGL